MEAFDASIEAAVQRALRYGLRGWQVTDCTVTMVRSGFIPRTSRRDFSLLTPLVLMDALSAFSKVTYPP